MSGNWIFRGKAFDSLSLSGKSSLFNASSTSEESISIMHIPEAMENIRYNSAVYLLVWAGLVIDVNICNIS